MKYRGYKIQRSGSNFYVQDARGFRAFTEPAATVEIAKKWIDAMLAELRTTNKRGS